MAAGALDGRAVPAMPCGALPGVGVIARRGTRARRFGLLPPVSGSGAACAPRRRGRMQPGGGGMGRFRRLAASCAGLVVLAALAVAAPARAQDTTLVTNTSISTSAATDTDSVEYAQGFRTGGNTAGYTVTEIDIKIDSQSSTVPPTVMLVKGYPRSANRVTLQGPAPLCQHH